MKNVEKFQEAIAEDMFIKECKSKIKNLVETSLESYYLLDTDNKILHLKQPMDREKLIKNYLVQIEERTQQLANKYNIQIQRHG